MNAKNKRFLVGFTVLLLCLAAPIAIQAQFTYATNNGTITITGYTGPGGAVTIPRSTNGLAITSIGDGAFFLSHITAITIPDSVTNIGNSAFEDCDKLTNIVVPGSVIRIGSDAFSTSGLVNITICSGVKSIGSGVFNGTAITALTIPASVTNLDSEAFYFCGLLTAAYFQGDAPVIGMSIFSGDPVTVYYLPGTKGWGATFGGAPTVLWNSQIQTSGGAFGIRTNQFGFNITGASNLTVLVESTTNLSNAAWSPISTNVLTGGSSYFSDPQWETHPTQYYRLLPSN